MSTRPNDGQPRLVMVFFRQGEAEAEAFAADRGWNTHCLNPAKNGEGVWLVKGVESMPEQYHGVRLFPEQFGKEVSVSCGHGSEIHTHVVSMAMAKVAGQNHGLLVKFAEQWAEESARLAESVEEWVESDPL